MRVAVTGASGKVGKVVVADLLEHGLDVRALSLAPHRDIAAPQIALDISDYGQAYNALEGCDALIHLAARPSPQEARPGEVLLTNTVGTNNVLQAAVARKIRRIAVASSDSAFGFPYSCKELQPDYLPMDEHHPDRPNDIYGLSKVFGEKMCDAVAVRNPDMTLVSLRISMVMCPSDYAYPFYDRVHKDPKMGSWNLWSFIDVRDASRAFRLAIQKERLGHEVLLVAASEQRTDRPTMDLIREFFPQAQIRRELKGHESLLNCSKAEKFMGFKPAYRWGGVPH